MSKLPDIVELLVPGTKRKIVTRLDPGVYKQYGEWIRVHQAIEVTELQFFHIDSDGDTTWAHGHYEWETASPAPPLPTRWERVVAWLRGNKIPKARQLLPTKIWRE